LPGELLDHNQSPMLFNNGGTFCVPDECTTFLAYWDNQFELLMKQIVILEREEEKEQELRPLGQAL